MPTAELERVHILSHYLHHCVVTTRNNIMASDPKAKGRNFVLTLHMGNVPTDEAIAALAAGPHPADDPVGIFANAKKHKSFAKGVYQVEVGDGGAVHAQGFLAYSQPVTVLTVAGHVGGGVHVEVSRDPGAAVDYSTKEETRLLGPFWYPQQFSAKAVGSGARTDLAAVVADIRKGKSASTIAKEHTEAFIKYPGGIAAAVAAHREAPVDPGINLYPWQQDMVDNLLAQDDRKITVVVDSVGGKGKSKLASWLAYHHGAEVLVPSELQHMVTALSNAQDDMKVLAIDCARNQGIPNDVYTLCEQAKDGRVLAPKYNSRMLRFKHQIKVIIFANTTPRMDAWSADRYDVRVLE